MRGIKVIITEMMAIEQIKEKIKALDDNDKKKITKYFYIAMMAFVVIIAILLMHTMQKKEIQYKNSINNASIEDIKFVISDDENINTFVSDYFIARHELNYPKIFKCYGRNYYTEIEDNERAKKIVDVIKYERTFVMNYDNINVYIAPGYRKNETVAVVTYDMTLGFSDGKIPMILVFYIANENGKYTILENFDVGTSKYIMDCMNTKEITELYEEIDSRLERSLLGNENLKLAYNTLRQFEMNMNGEFIYGDDSFLDKMGYKGLNLIKDIGNVYENVAEQKQNDANKEVSDFLISLFTATKSEVK